MIFRGMPTYKPKIIFVADKDLLERLDDFRFQNRINSRSEAIRRLLEESPQEIRENSEIAYLLSSKILSRLLRFMISLGI